MSRHYDVNHESAERSRELYNAGIYMTRARYELCEQGHPCCATFEGGPCSADMLLRFPELR